MVNENIPKVNQWFQDNKSDLLMAGLVFLMLAASFGLGRLSVLWLKKPEIRISEPQSRGGERDITDIQQAASMTSEKPKNLNSEKQPAGTQLSNAQGKYVASRSGTAYHYPWCPGAQKIKESNKIWFQTKEEAQAKGYKPAGNCLGL